MIDGIPHAPRVREELKKRLSEAVASVQPANSTEEEPADVLDLHVYCSPFSRTIATARLAAGQAGLTASLGDRRFQVRCRIAAPLLPPQSF